MTQVEEPIPAGWKLWLAPHVPPELTQFATAVRDHINDYPYGQVAEVTTDALGRTIGAFKSHHTWSFLKQPDGTRKLVRGLWIPGISLVIQDSAPAIAGEVDVAGEVPWHPDGQPSSDTMSWHPGHATAWHPVGVGGPDHYGPREGLPFYRPVGMGSPEHYGPRDNLPFYRPVGMGAPEHYGPREGLPFYRPVGMGGIPPQPHPYAVRVLSVSGENLLNGEFPLTKETAKYAIGGGLASWIAYSVGASALGALTVGVGGVALIAYLKKHHGLFA